VDAALDAKYHPIHRDVFEPIFGEDLDRLLSEASTVHDPARYSSSDQLIESADVPQLIERFIHDTKASLKADDLFGLDHIPEFDLSIREGLGFAEYWPIELNPGAAKDLLVVFLNDDSRHSGFFRSTLAHELFPGHGYFYSRMRQSRDCSLDYGAMTLIEGWATWAEWHTFPDRWSKFGRRSRLSALQFFNVQAPDLEDQLLNTMLAHGYSLENAELSLLEFYQYPGSGFSYSLGALWFEHRFQRQKPRDFLEFLGIRPWGDFFQSWRT
jgi:hypothetical protein